MTDPLSLTETKRLAGTADTILLRATRTADLETPIGAFLRLDDGVDARLPARVGRGRRAPRSLQLPGHRPAAAARGPDGVAHTTSRPVGVTDYAPDLPGHRAAETPDPLDRAARVRPARRVVPVEGMPRFTGGAVGALAYDAIATFEPSVPLPERTRSASRWPASSRPTSSSSSTTSRTSCPRSPRSTPRRPDLEGRYRIAERAIFEALERTARPSAAEMTRGASPARRTPTAPSGSRPGRHQPRSRRVHPRGRAGEGRDRGRRGDPGRARPPPVVRPPGRGGRRARSTASASTAPCGG